MIMENFESGYILNLNVSAISDLQPLNCGEGLPNLNLATFKKQPGYRFIPQDNVF